MACYIGNDFNRHGKTSGAVTRSLRKPDQYTVTCSFRLSLVYYCKMNNVVLLYTWCINLSQLTKVYVSNTYYYIIYILGTIRPVDDIDSTVQGTIYIIQYTPQQLTHWEGRDDRDYIKTSSKLIILLSQRYMHARDSFLNPCYL